MTDRFLARARLPLIVARGRVPKLDPPLRRSDNLIHRLGSLPSFREDRVAYFPSPDPRPGPSGFLRGELDHLKRRGGIVFNRKSLPTDFDVVVAARSFVLPNDDEILGIPALLPTGLESESHETESQSHKTDSGSHRSQET